MNRYPTQAGVNVTVSDRNRTQRDSLTNEAAVRRYLRLLAGSPVHTSDHFDLVETSFIECVANWAYEAGVQRRTLAKWGVPSSVLTAAGVKARPVSEQVRREYSSDLFTIEDLVRKSGVSNSSVRKVVAEDERVGRVVRVATRTRTVLYRSSR